MGCSTSSHQLPPDAVLVTQNNEMHTSSITTVPADSPPMSRSSRGQTHTTHHRHDENRSSTNNKHATRCAGEEQRSIELERQNPLPFVNTAVALRGIAAKQDPSLNHHPLPSLPGGVSVSSHDEDAAAGAACAPAVAGDGGTSSYSMETSNLQLLASLRAQGSAGYMSSSDAPLFEIV